MARSRGTGVVSGGGGAFQFDPNKNIFAPGGQLAASYAAGRAPRSAGAGGGYSQASSPEWRGIQQPTEPGIPMGSNMPMPPYSSAGLFARAEERRNTLRNEAANRGDWDAINVWGAGKLDPKWDAWFQALQEQGADRLAGGASPAGSNQLRGFSAQPQFLTTGTHFMGRPNLDYKAKTQQEQEIYNQERAKRGMQPKWNSRAIAGLRSLKGY